MNRLLYLASATLVLFGVFVLFPTLQLSAQETGAGTGDAISLDGGVEITPEELALIATRVYQNPDQADQILREEGLTEEQFRRALWAVSSNPQWSRRYRGHLDLGDFLTQRKTHIEAGFSFSDLEGDGNRVFDDWQTQFVSAERRLGKQTGVYGEISRARWFDETDEEIMLGAYFPVNKKLRVNVRGSVSPSNKILPRWSGTGILRYWLGMGFEIEGSFQGSDYTRRDTRFGSGTLRKYWNNYWVSYSYGSSWIGSDGPEPYHQFNLGYTKGLANFGVGYSDGEAITEVSNPNGNTIQIRNVDTLSLWGKYPLNSRLRLTGEIVQQDVEDLYDRFHVGLGIQYRFM